MAPSDMLTQNEGVRWMSNGQSILSGPALQLYKRLDAMFLEWAQRWNAEEYAFPTFISAHELNKLDYFRSFPHLITFPVCLDDAEENLEVFTNGEPIDECGCLSFSKTRPVADVLTPAACYHFYIALQNQTLNQPKYLTTRATCFRREAAYSPLMRQWSFNMREVVCIGSHDEVAEFLASFRELLEFFFAESGLPVTFENATDPFFQPVTNPKYAMQKIDPVKTEIVFDNRLAIGSLNLHRTYFGETFNITRSGQTLSSGCVAFGLERWLYLLLNNQAALENGIAALTAMDKATRTTEELPVR